jgi:exonuclease SbcC
MKAVRILKELAGERRLIGIISHVTELKEQIGKKLLVEKSERGSKIRWDFSQ